jgi:DNA repair protein RadC
MPITSWPLAERPRERLLQQGAQTLSDAELLAVFLRTGVKGKTAVDLARDLLQQFGSLRGLLSASHEDFCKAKGLGTAKFALLQAVLEMAQRHLREDLSRHDVVRNQIQMKSYFVSQLRHQQREVFACLFLDNQHRVLAFEELFYGTVNVANIFPREVVKRALELNAVAVIFSHNHPSGNTHPSSEDKDVTRKLVDALAIVGVKVLDHIIVGEGPVASFAELGLL